MAASEGKYIYLLVIVAVMAMHVLFGKQVWPLWFILLAIMWLYREPKRRVPAAPNGVVSPCDATVASIREMIDPCTGAPAICITLHKHVLGVFQLYSPTEGKVTFFKVIPQTKFRINLSVSIETDERDIVSLLLHCGRKFGQMKCYIREGERIGQGRRCGFIPLGATLEVFVAAGSRILVEPGQRLLGGTDILAEFVHSQG